MKKEEAILKAKINKIIILPSIIMTIFSISCILSYDYPLYDKIYGWSIWVLLSLYFLIITIHIIIRILTTNLFFTNVRLIGKHGIIITKRLDAPINKINDIMIHQNLIGKIFHYSTIIISTSSSKYRYEYIKNSNEFKDALTQQISQLDTQKNSTIDNNVNYDKLKKIKSLLDENIITQEEFEKEKQKLLQ